MNKTLILLGTATLIALVGFQISSLVETESTNLTLDPPKTVPYVDINKYLGTWY